MERILRQFSFLDNEKFGIITKLCLKYSANEEITESDGNAEMLLFFNSCVKPQLKEMMRARKKEQKRRMKNER